MSEIVADRRLYLSADKSKVVEDVDPAAAFLLAGEGAGVPAAEVARLRLELRDGRVVQALAEEPGGAHGEVAGEVEPALAPKFASDEAGELYAAGRLTPEQVAGVEPSSPDGLTTEDIQAGLDTKQEGVAPSRRRSGRRRKP